MRIRSFDAMTLASAINAGVVLAATDVMLEISIAAFVFSGPLAPFVGAGIGYFLFGTFAVGLVVAVTSAFPHGIGVVQDTPAVILAVALAAVASALPAGTPALLPTAVAAMALTTLAASALFLMLGMFRLGNLVRYVPYPVIGGFLAGTGLLLVDGAVNVMAGSGITAATLPVLLRAETVVRWLPGLGLAVVVLVVLRRSSHPLALPGLLIGAAALFHGVLWVGGIPAAAARAGGWLLGPFPDEGLWQPPTVAILQQARWDVIVAQSGTLATLLLIALLSFLLNATGLELAARRDVELNRELKVAGVANAISGLGGGPVGYHALGLSTLSYRMTPHGRLTGVVVAAVFGVALFGGATVLAFLPTFLPGGILLFLGLDFLVTWLYDARARLSHSEHAIVAVIAVTMAVVGVLEGVALGSFLAMVLFIVVYSRGSPIHRTLSGQTHRSNVDRPPAERQVLHDHGGQIHILELQRFIFFGTANRLLEAVRELVAAEHVPRFIVLDFRRVTGLDASAGSSFARVRQLAELRGFVVVLTGLSPRMRQQLRSAGFAADTGATWGIFADLDHGVEWCEAQLLADATMVTDVEDSSAATRELAAIIDHMTPLQLPAGARLIEEGQRPNGLYYLQAGLLTAQVEGADGRVVRLRKMRPGVFIGELSLYTDASASASVIADEPSMVLFLAAADLARLERENPAAAAAFHRHIARLASERLLDATTSMSALF
jgi:sulfate permease, SulP family